jgi:predicted enzyme related to lactoylglutathione lyase
VQEVISLGGSFAGERRNFDAGVLVVMADPEGNEFCLVQYFWPAVATEDRRSARS